MIVGVVMSALVSYAVHVSPPADNWRGVRMLVMMLVSAAMVAAEVKSIGY